MASGTILGFTRYGTAFGVPSPDLEVWEAESTYMAASPVPGQALDQEEHGKPSRLRVLTSGTPTSSAEAIDIETVRGGFPDQGATMRWRKSSTTDWVQSEDRLRPHRTEHFFWDSGATLDRVSAAVLSDGRTVYAYIQDEGSGVGLVRIAVEQNDGSWDRETVDGSQGVDAPIWVSIGADDAITVWQWVDGLYRTTTHDEGTTWHGHGRPLTGTSGSASRFEVAEGGGQLLCVGSDGTPGRSFYFASKDGGHTWDEIADVTTGTAIPADASPHVVHTDYGFLVSNAAREITIWPDAYGEGATDTLDTFTAGLRSGLAWDGVRMYAWHMVSTARNRIIYVDWSEDGGETWTSFGASDDFIGLTNASTGEAVLTFGRTGRLLHATGSDGAYIYELGGWTTQAIPNPLADPERHQPWSFLYVPLHNSLPTSYSDYYGTNGGTMGGGASGITDSTTGGEKVVFGSGTSGDYSEFNFTPAAVGEMAVVEAVLDGADEFAEVGISLNNFRVFGTVDMDGRELTLQEASGASVTAPRNIIGTGQTAGTGKIRIRLISTDTGYASLLWRQEGDIEWTKAYSNVKFSAASSASDLLYFRVFSKSGSVDVELYEWRGLTDIEYTSDTAGTPENAEPRSSDPASADWSGRPLYLEEGVSVRASGWTQTGEQWESTPGATHGPDRLLTETSPSPRDPFRTTGTSTTRVAYRVPNAEAAANHVVYITGCNAPTVAVETHNGTSWSAATTIDFRTYSSSAYTALAGGYHVVLGGNATSSAEQKYVEADQLTGASFIDSAGTMHEITSNTAGAVANDFEGPRVILTLATAANTTSGACSVAVQSAATIIAHGAETAVHGVRLTPSGTPHAGYYEIGAMVIAPLIFLPENPDQTRTEVITMGETLEELPNGRRLRDREMPDYRRWELNFAKRQLMMKSQEQRDLDWLEFSSTDPGTVRWSTPQVLRALTRKAGRAPFVYLPRVSYGTAQTGAGPGYLVQIQSESVRLEGVRGHAETQDQTVRTSTLSLVEVV